MTKQKLIILNWLLSALLLAGVMLLSAVNGVAVDWPMLLTSSIIGGSAGTAIILVLTSSTWLEAVKHAPRYPTFEQTLPLKPNTPPAPAGMTGKTQRTYKTGKTSYVVFINVPENAGSPTQETDDWRADFRAWLEDLPNPNELDER